jgi:hypothetical protein
MEEGLLNRASPNLRVVTLTVQYGKLRKLDRSKPSKCKARRVSKFKWWKVCISLAKGSASTDKVMVSFVGDLPSNTKRKALEWFMVQGLRFNH